MNAKISIYAKFNQTKVDKNTKERHTTIAEREITKLQYSVNPKLNKAKQLQAVTTFVTHAIGARYKAVIVAGKKLPSKLYFHIELDGEVYRSETALLKANFSNLVTVSLSALKKLPISEVIADVAGTQKLALLAASSYISDLRDIAAMVDKTTFDGKDESLNTLKVEPTGELVETA